MNTIFEGKQIGYSGRSNTPVTGLRRGIGLVCLVLAAATAAPGQDEQPAPNAVKFKTMFSFGGSNGIHPTNVIQGLDGLYGTTSQGRPNFDSGTIFRITPAGALTTTYTFCQTTNCPDGGAPGYSAWLALGTNGDFYGTAIDGGANGHGTIFKITPSGSLTTLYSFCSQPNCADGDIDYSGLARGADGNFYGVTLGDGANNNPMCPGGANGVGCGTVYKITPEGAFNTIYSFCSQPNCADGDGPFLAPVSGADGNLYGMTCCGGAYGYGTIYKITRGGTLTTLHSFNGADGSGCLYCEGMMVQSANGKLYGTSQYGGANSNSGTFFEITSAGTFTKLYDFCSLSNCADAANPSEFIQATDGNFYGLATLGGAYGNGTIFEITPKGILTTLHNFNGADGSDAWGLAQATNGTLYGATALGGTNGYGTAFSLSVGLGPFVETVPTVGKVGATIQILGGNLTGATAVTFNGVAAHFTVVSQTLITATVPTGASFGLVTVATPARTLKSNVKFQVPPPSQ